ncbi:MAG TPA: hypothetical protein VMA09_23215 [Candidatus Binataceae bacterium]|nr:hypothetical protein [Candidatus Binataceae bacterium]
MAFAPAASHATAARAKHRILFKQPFVDGVRERLVKKAHSVADRLSAQAFFEQRLSEGGAMVWRYFRQSEISKCRDEPAAHDSRVVDPGGGVDVWILSHATVRENR